MNIKNIFLSFAIVFVLALGSATFTIITIKELTTHTQKMYSHPFRVSNAIADIQTSIITMHRNMKDVVLTNDSLKLIKIIEDIQKEEEKVYVNFEIIYNKYLGEKKDIAVPYLAFKNWKAIRQEVISLVYKKEKQKAIMITQGKGASHILNLYKKIEVLKNFAFNKANEYYQLSMKSEPLEQIISSYLLTFLIGLFIIMYIIKSLIKSNKANKKQLYLIDQNILLATLSLDKQITNISSALCSVLNIKKNKILNTTNSYFFTNKEYYENFENIIFSGKNYKGEIPIKIENQDFWYEIEIIPNFNEDYILNYFSIFLTNVSDKKEIERVAILDTLTGLYNRNYFEKIFDKEINRAKRDKKELSMLMLDIDHFKKFNDTYGHQEGDLALKEVSNLILNHAKRSYDYAFRIGGEEFVLLSYQKDYELLKSYSLKLIKEVEKLKIPHINNSASKYVTISAGAAQFSKNNHLASNEMFKKVDELLYEAKESGRNTVKSSYI